MKTVYDKFLKDKPKQINEDIKNDETQLQIENALEKYKNALKRLKNK